MLIYDDNHSLISDPVEIDSVINGALWFVENNSKFIPPPTKNNASIIASTEEEKSIKVGDKLEEKAEEKKLQEKK